MNSRGKQWSGRISAVWKTVGFQEPFLLFVGAQVTRIQPERRKKRRGCRKNCFQAEQAGLSHFTQTK